MKLKRLLNIIAVALILFEASFITSCKKFVSIPLPEDYATSASVFSDDQSAVSAMDGLYSNMMATNLFFMNGAVSIYAGLSADEIVNTSSNSYDDPFYQNAIQNTNGIIDNNLWRMAYSYIYQANSILAGIKNSTTISKGIADQLTGEAKFTRAYCYFYLVNLFGPVPLITGTDYRVNEILPRSKTDSIYRQITEDLENAFEMLSKSSIAGENTRPSKWSAVALLARVYLFQQNWVDAERESSNIIDSRTFNLENNLDSVFLKTSKETIWQLVPSTGYYNTAEGASFIPFSSSVIPTYVVNNSLLRSFEIGDRRKLHWIDSNVVNNVAYYYPYKYKIASGSELMEDNIALRLAEQYLIRSEARAHQNNIIGALDDLNIIRRRAGLSDIKLNDVSALLTAIQREWQDEFFCEWGHRWLNLKRTAKASEVLSKIKLKWTDDDTLYPIPFSQIQTNPFLTQNIGY